VVSTDAAKGEVTLNHEAIPGFMDAMTMPYKLKDANILSELHPGDVITADVLVSQDPNADVLLDHIVVVAQGKPDYRPSGFLSRARAGRCGARLQAAQSGWADDSSGAVQGQGAAGHLHLHALPAARLLPAGDAILRVDKQTGGQPGALRGKTHLLCVSFDPEHDTPERLRAYGATYIGSDAKSAFAHWDFAVPEKPCCWRWRSGSMWASPRGGRTITHTLSTTLIGPDGKVVKFYPGNEWTPREVLADVKQLPQKGSIACRCPVVRPLGLIIARWSAKCVRRLYDQKGGGERPMSHGLNIRKDAELDFLSLGALVHRLDPGIIPFRKATECKIHVSGGEFNVAANLSDCFG
jgi:protein SCO1